MKLAHQLMAACLVVGLSTHSPLARAAPPAQEAGASNAASQVLTLQEVLDSTAATHPKNEIADLKRQGAEGRALASRGNWDPRLKVGGRWVPVGYYPTGQVDASVRQATPLWGASVYAGYRLGLGSFPDYKGELETLSAGELRAGVDVPLWKDGRIDKGRAEIAQARALVDSARCDQGAVGLKQRQAAAKAYWRWVATGLEVGIQVELLAVAQERQAALAAQSELGSVAPITVVDNRRLVLDRQSKLVKAERDFARSVVELSLYFRDQNLGVIQAGAERLPAQIADVAIGGVSLDQDLVSALGARPELCALRGERQAAATKVRLTRNQIAPAVNAQAFVARDVGVGSDTLAPTDFGAGLTISMPIGFRKARGEAREARAKLAQVDAKSRALSDHIGAEVRKVQVDLFAAKKQVGLTAAQLEVAEALASAERDRFDEGASNLVVVNLRETAAARAARAHIEAQAALQIAWANYRAVIGQDP